MFAEKNGNASPWILVGFTFPAVVASAPGAIVVARDLSRDGADKNYGKTT